MNERGALIVIHAGLFLLQIGAAIAAIVWKPELAAVNVTIGVAQAYFPRPWGEKISGDYETMKTLRKKSEQR